MSEPGTLGRYIEDGARLSAYHERLEPFCCHSAPLDLGQLAAKLGPDFNIIDHRADFLSRFRCTRCGTRGALGMGIIVAPAQAAYSGKVRS